MSNKIFDKTVPVSQPLLSQREKDYVSQCMDSGWISSQGHFVKRFERSFADFVGAKYAVSTSSGTSALHLSLLALGITAGDEVIVPNLTFAATANAVLHCGARPILCDIHPDTWTIDIDQVEHLIGPNTKAVIPVHLFGIPADMMRLKSLCDRHNLSIIEDCAQAIGARINKKHVGTHGNFGCFSFFANKTMTTGEGGMVVTDDYQEYKRLSCFRDHGMSSEQRYWHLEAGLNCRMTNVQAAIGLAQLEQLAHYIDRRNQIKKRYASSIANVDGLSFAKEPEDSICVTWLTAIQIGPEAFAMTATELLSLLGEYGVDSRRFFPPLNIQPPYLEQSRSFPVSTSVSENGLCLPTFVGMTDAVIDEIADVIVQHAEASNSVHYLALDKKIKSM